MTELAEVVTIYEANASDMVAMLRQTADSIEKGECAPIRSITAVAELEEGKVQIYGWGQTDTPRSLAVLQLVLTWLTNDQLSRWKDE